jgi:hypothetical protein
MDGNINTLLDQYPVACYWRSYTSNRHQRSDAPKRWIRYYGPPNPMYTELLLRWK